MDATGFISRWWHPKHVVFFTPIPGEMNGLKPPTIVFVWLGWAYGDEQNDLSFTTPFATQMLHAWYKLGVVSSKLPHQTDPFGQQQLLVCKHEANGCVDSLLHPVP